MCSTTDVSSKKYACMYGLSGLSTYSIQYEHD